MLPPFIIEQIRKREEQDQRRDNRPLMELPLPVPPVPRRRQDPEEEVERGVVIIDLGV